jgi:hypothetical protein
MMLQTHPPAKSAASIEITLFRRPVAARAVDAWPLRRPVVEQFNVRRETP